MKRGWRLPATLLKTYYDYMVEYRAELILWVLSGSLPLIMMGVWDEAVRSGDFGLSTQAVVQYFLAVFLARQLTVVWVIWEFEKEVVKGQLSFRLLQPLDPGWHHFASHIAERLARLPFIVLLLGLAIWLYPAAWVMPSLWRLLLFLVAIAAAFCLRFLIQYTFAMLSFWIERASALEQFWFLAYLFLSGMVAPLSVFPEQLQAIVIWTPFPYLIYFPVAILLDLPVAIAPGFAILSIWMGLFWLLNRWLWRRGLRQYSAMGA
ncbi:ABC-2 family transporter protein [Synechococcus elongatus IITB4]|uniref:ABC transporter permease n=1 Tax=Synechococcus elongatus TaxID=32046 RepID=UPI0030D05992